MIKYLWVFLLLLSGCGTETGNPLRDVPRASPVEDIITFQSLPDLVCEKLDGCFTDVPSNCSSLVEADENYGDALGVSGNGHFSLAQIFAAINLGNYVINLSATQNCLSEIRQLECSSSLLQQSYNGASSTPLDNTSVLLTASASCTNILQYNSNP